MLRRMSFLGALLVAACGTSEEVEVAVGGDQMPFSSDQATLLEFEFAGELVARSSWGLERIVEQQMLYTVGQLNGDNAVARLDQLVVTNIQRTSIGGGQYRVQYNATLPVGWGSKTNLPSKYELLLPKGNGHSDLEDFTDKYKDDCVDFAAHDVDSGSM